MVRIRFAKTEDAEPLARVHIRTWQVAYRGLIPDEVLDNLDLPDRSSRWLEAIEQSEQDVLIAVDGPRLCGFCSLESLRNEHELGRTIGEITSIYVDPTCWRRGLGSALFTEALRRARNRGFLEIRLWVLEENHGARAFYEKIGLRREGGEGFTRGFGGGVELAEIQYRMRLCTRVA